MQNSDAFSDALLDAAASSTFKDHDNGFGEFIRFRCCTNSFHERSGCSWSIAPPPRRSRPNYVRRIDEKHHPSLADPAEGGWATTIRSRRSGDTFERTATAQFRQVLTRDDEQSPLVGNTLQGVSPRSDNAISEPTSWNFTASDRNTSPGPARSQMRLAMLTVRPTTSSGRTSTSPVRTPARTSNPVPFAAATISVAARRARVVPSRTARAAWSWSQRSAPKRNRPNSERSGPRPSEG